MSTKTAQLGGTASEVTVGKIGVSVISIDPTHPGIDPSFPHYQHGLMMMTCALLFFVALYLRIDAFHPVGATRKLLMKKHSRP